MNLTKQHDLQRELFSNLGTTFVHPEDGEHQIVLLSDAPSAEEEKEGRLFVGKTALMRDAITQVFNKAPYITSVLKFRPHTDDGKDRRPTEEEVDAFYVPLMEEFTEISPNVVVCLGSTAYSVLSTRQFSEYVGQSMTTLCEGRMLVVIPCYHPAFIARKGGSGSAAWNVLIDCLEEARDLCSST
jgi:uracil-DNA glycosylase family 4